MVPSIRTYHTIHPKTRGEWRDWLEKNHDRSPGVWITYFKKASGKQTLSYEEAVQEALCYGWVDSQAGAIDEERYKQLFSPRKKGSTWARSNKKRVEALIKEGCMTVAGLAKVEEAKGDGSWDQLDIIDELIVPDELSRALRANSPAEQNFQALSVSKRKQLLWWLASAKRPETRERRIADIVRLAAGGKGLDLAERKKDGPPG